MHLFFETRLDLLRVAGNMHFFVRKPTVSPEPVLVGDTETDELGAHIYGSVHHDQGVYRMWYQATANAWAKHDSPAVAYAESDDGITWRKPSVGLVDIKGSKDNNLCDLGVHDPSISILPDAPPERRYFATGCIDARYEKSMIHREARPPVGGGFYAAYSANGIHWELESPHPIWEEHWADNICNVWHPSRQSIQVLAKHTCMRMGIVRRNYWECQRTGDEWSPLRMSLIPDEFDDIAARSRGYVSGDYNGFALMPTERSTVSFIQMHRNRLPYRDHPVGQGCGVYGVMDMTLAFQEDEDSCWIHMPGRPDFVSHHDIPWAGGMLFCASNVCNFGDEQRLYISGSAASHGVIPFGDRRENNRIGYVSWPRDRLFGYHADDEGELDIDLGIFTKPAKLQLNYETDSGGSIHVQLHTLEKYQRRQDGIDIEGRSAEGCVPLTGECLDQTIEWKNGSVIAPIENRRIIARVIMKRAKVYAFGLQ